MKAMLEEVFSREVNVTVVFEYPTIRLMSQYFNELQSTHAQREDMYEERIEEDISFMKLNLVKLVGDEYEDDED